MEGEDCSACMAPFGFFRRKHPCGKCKLVFCSSCTQKEQGMEICDPCTMSVVLAPQRNELMQKMAQLPLHIQAAMAPINTSIATMAEVANSHTRLHVTAPRTVSYTIICHSVLTASSH